MIYCNVPKYFGTEIVSCSLCKLHFLFADSHVLPDTKHRHSDSNTLTLGLHPTPNCEDVSNGHSRRRHACIRVDRVIVSFNKFRENVYTAVRILEL